ncbi:MAG: CDGSH iron-sulfur domain-containing protein [Rhodospirillaceae bacterium]|jgi:CDGSH iron-sulfur domain-containing protein 3|nr:CDGSH iron-sulfur domain-containing protein [Rhodospirillaceae bacterium]MBT4486806.1 CDGSH iron-sulfur domain-containing protein [Rhodospirillaceae bacterium]MBT5194477.1 CDGSH iron-sulfur domain-containing protein [Rhodospirillaceae bacterium]MBT5895221.1 CDGSH iron-sulfur domain-containing protein [Rhodospirillaceae bacterium]MBT6431024.1 CDGSH iron-sulfur domain-containing protein [Rhodospirillaceae bacterium]
MSDAVVAQEFPYFTDLEEGKDYFWCSCGKSSKQPFCDGSHKGSDFAPVKFSVDKTKSYSLCGCKQNDGKPFCNGAHNKL